MRQRCAKEVEKLVVRRTQTTSLLRIRPQSLKGVSCEQQRGQRYTSTATGTVEEGTRRSRSLALASEARFNEIGVQHVSRHVHEQLFPGRRDGEVTSGTDQQLVELSKKHLARHELLGKQSQQAEPVAFDLPALQGQTLDEHFYRLGRDASEPYLTLATQYARASPPPKPRRWERRSGWTKYHPDGTSEPIDAPDADVLTFDVEVMWRETNYPAMACAVSGTHWYAWLSPWLLGESENDAHLIPLGDPTKQRIVVGHNIGYDRARIAEEYSLKQSKNFFLDTMSLHVAVNGMCSRQRPNWTKARKARERQDDIANSEDHAELSSLLSGGNEAGMEDEEELWVGRSSANSLRDVAKFHCNIVLDKTQRDSFGELDRDGLFEKLDELLDYCAADVEVTHKVYKKVFPNFLRTCPHPVSFAALRHLSTEILPVNRGWEAYIKNAEATYQRLSTAVEERLHSLAEKVVAHKDEPEVYDNDPWLRQLDWSGQAIRYLKAKKKGEEPRMAAKQKKPGMPAWYKELFAKNDSPMALTVRTRVAPLLLRLAWDGHPLVWSDKYGWCFAVRSHSADSAKYTQSGMTVADMAETESAVDEKLKNDVQHTYFKLPHVDGPTARCANPLAKGYLQYFENEVLGSEYAYAKEALQMNASCSYWISARDRITRQMAVFSSELAGAAPGQQEPEQGFILPQIIPMGTITRRAIENTWLTAANAKKNRVGSELKSMITAPPGYTFVGADVDAQELWIASLLGDSSFRLHGGGASGFMVLEGSKAAGTDGHSRTASILGINRNDAKVFNFGRIYGAGLKFAQTLLRKFSPGLGEEKAAEVAGKLYQTTKGTKGGSKVLRERKFWYGGTESLVFNRLEDFAEQERPRTPVLGAGITEALMRRFLASKGSGNFLTSRINWAIQSSGVDYLHLLIVSMDYLTRRYNIDARLALTVHDEVRYLAKEEDKYRCAMALQVANVWTRAMFSQQMGIDELPQSCAYFSAVDIDHVLRKETDMDCITPSNPTAIPPGESLDITQLLDLGGQAYLDPEIKAVDMPRPERFAYEPRQPVMEGLKQENGMYYLRAQIANDKKELQEIVKELKPPVSRPFNDGPKHDEGSPKSAARKERASRVKVEKAPRQERSPRLKRPSTASAPSKTMAAFHLSAWKPRTWQPRPLPVDVIPKDQLDWFLTPPAAVHREGWASTGLSVGLMERPALAPRNG